jgi:hypothetical protein
MNRVLQPSSGTAWRAGCPMVRSRGKPLGNRRRLATAVHGSGKAWQRVTRGLATSGKDQLMMPAQRRRRAIERI